MEVAEVTLVHTLFPKYSAAVTQIGAHSVDGYAFAKAAAKAPDAGGRLDNAVLAYRAFDHTITATRDLPLGKLVPGLGKYIAGYEAAKAVVTLIVASGLVPGAGARVGKQDMTGATTEFHHALDAYKADSSRYGRYVALDWLRSAQEDAATGVLMLRRTDIARPLLGGLELTRRQIAGRKEVPAAQVKVLDDLLRQAGDALSQVVADAEARAAAAPPATLGAREAQVAAAAAAAAARAPLPVVER